MDARPASSSLLGVGVVGLVALVVAVYLTGILATTRWTMDADEAVHAVEALRLYDDLVAADPAAFLEHTYFPERWQPPVDPHVRWYPFVHAWVLVPFFTLLGPGDLSARFASVVLLAATAVVFYFLGRRLQPTRPLLAGVLAGCLVLGAPNLLTFSAQSLVETTSLFTCYLALLAYLRSLERGHPTGRAVVAGLLLAVAILTKYDHGGVLALCVGVAELVRVRFRPRELWRSGGALLLACGLVPTLLWFAHPDKLAALGDSVSHPFHGTPRAIFMDFFLTGIVEYGASLAVGIGGWLALVATAGRLREPALRALWIWAAFGVGFYALRGRYHFRYNFVEAPALLLLLAVQLPTWAERFAGSARRAADGVRVRRDRLALVVCGLLAVAGGWTLFAPRAVVEALRGPFRMLHGLRSDHFGMQRGADHYVDFFRDEYAPLVADLGGSLVALALAAGFALAWRSRMRATPEHEGWERGRAVFLAAFGIASLPGVVLLYAELRSRVEWELEGHPELNEVHGFVARTSPPGTTVLLGGGWDQLTNNSLRWYRATGGRDLGETRVPLADVPVVGDMIGSIVFPPEPRIAHWAGVLATAPHEQLPDRVVLVEPGDSFLYHERFGPEVEIYTEIVSRRGSHRLAEVRTFPQLDCEVRVLNRTDASEPIEPPGEILAHHGILPDSSETSRRWRGEGGWEMKDDSFRHHRTSTGRTPSGRGR